MSDIKTVIKGEDSTLHGDLSVSSGQLEMDEGLNTAVLHSLFTDARAREDDELPWGETDRRGCWFDPTLPKNAAAGRTVDRYGSRLWLLSRAKQTAETLARAKEYAEEALQWLVDDGIAVKVEVTAEWQSRGYMALTVQIYRRDGSIWSNAYPWQGVIDAV